MMFVKWRVVPLILVIFLSGCTTYYQSPPKMLADGGDYWHETHYNAEVVAEDGTRIRMTVYQPRLKKGETAPLLIHAHGFGLGRMHRQFSLYGELLLAGEVSIDAWKHGYWVISYDQRGFGSSDGMVSLISPEKEGADVSRVIDWAVSNLPLTLRNNVPAVGMIGESYGAGAQFAATVQDKRISALVPLTGWYDLEQALFPNGVAKSDWLTFLGIAGYATAPLSMDSSVVTGTFKEIFGKGDPDLRKRLHDNSLAGHCSGEEGPHADALLIQGFRDVLFPFNQAVEARACFQKAGRDVRLIGVEAGHMNPFSQISPGLPIWTVQKNVTCADKVIPVHGLIMNWLNGKLRDDEAALAQVPKYCVTGDVADTETVDTVWQPLTKVHISTGITGMLEWIDRPLDRLGNLFIPSGLPSDWQEPSNGWLRPARVPLFSPTEPTWIVGVPHVELKLSDSNRKDAVLFLRLAVWRHGSGTYHALNDQVTPVHANGPLDVDLSAVKALIKPGDVLGLLVQGHSSQFRLTGSGMRTSVSVEGRVALPLPQRMYVHIACPDKKNCAASELSAAKTY